MNDQYIVEGIRLEITYIDLEHRKKKAFCFQAFVWTTDLVEHFHPGQFEVLNIVLMVDESHLVGFRIS
jgi:hypothetical protein